MINKTTFAYAITNIDDDLVTEFAPDTSNRVGAATKRRASSYYIKAVAAALGLTAAITAVTVFGVFKSPTENSPETVDRALLASETDPETAAVLQTDETEAESENNSIILQNDFDNKKSFPFSGPSYKNYKNYSLALVKPGRCCGVYYYGNVDKTSGKFINKYLVYEATVEKDYYENLKQGDTVYVAFSLKFFYYDTDSSIISIKYSYLDDEKLKDIISNWDSFIFYSKIDAENYTTLCETEIYQNNTVDFFKLGYCEFTKGIIPIVDSAVDYTSIDSLPNLPVSNGMFSIYHRIRDGFGRHTDYSISQGDSIEKVSETIETLIEINIYGGLYYENEEEHYKDPNMDYYFNHFAEWRKQQDPFIKY